ncbi:MAG: NFYB/HAP3 family transcription factor subunit [Candidatus Woesearchaeota archaeon]
MAKNVLSLTTMEKLMRSAGADRVADKAKAALRDYLEDVANKISQNAMKYASHSGRKTIKSSDIKLAIEHR